MSKVLYIVDADREFTRCLSALLHPTDVEIELRTSAEEFLEAFQPDRAACVLVDAQLPGMSGMELLRHLRENHPRVPAVLTAAFGSSGLTTAALEAGALDLLVKPFDARAIDGMLDAIRSAISNSGAERTLAPLALLPSIETLRERFGRLTEREMEIARLVALGHSSKSIAASLKLSKRTVDNHRAHILEKLQLENFVQVARSLSLLQAAS
jgi:FixJ family two-component response regulator